MQETGLEQFAHHHGKAPHAVDVDHVVPAVRLGVGDVGHTRRHPVEVVERELDPRLVGDGQKVQHGVGRPAERHDDGDGVLEGRLGHDVAGSDVAGEQLDARRAPDS